MHNFEEAWTICMGTFEFNPFIVSNIQFVIAVSLFTILGFILVFGKNLYRSQKYYQYAITGFAGMLFLNTFFPHILSAFYFRTYMPGFITALILILPLTSLIL
ncbi:MAG: HXXEE domain-containing protein [Dysgonamonadaceae bacterium]|nr:HXXEE domain-containing protein [Dysgonamonadaceae bacterium]